MNTNHLTDESLQAYILEDISDSQITLHISECADCKAKLKSYQALLNRINKLEPELFSFDVTELVLQKIEATETKKTILGDYTLMILLGVFILSVILFSFPIIKPIFQPFWSLDFLGNAFIIVSTIGVLMFLFVDILMKFKQKELLLLQ
ncbi:MAG TPA: hypothetical protein PKC62_08690 [Ferruginibacter sp.]|jgi:uncharacterized membrane protein YcjF (UPF0283 family)|nr:hypothetical protein [Bacteroidota bacterium]HMT96749.1 hypothetical protein [Ferruginibacter sp.]